MSTNDIVPFNRNAGVAPAVQGAPLVMLDERGQGRTIVVDAAVLATHGTDDHIIDFLSIAEMHDYRVVVQSSAPGPALDGPVGQKMRASKRLEVFMGNRQTSRPILLTGSPEVTMGKPIYLRLTHDRSFQPNDWAPHDRRIALNLDVWVNGPGMTGENVARLQAILAAAGERLKVHRRQTLALRSTLFTAMAEAGIDPHAWERDLNNRIDTMRGLGPKPPGSKGPGGQ